MRILPFALGLGLLAGLRTFTPVAAVAWAAHLGLLRLAGTPLAFLGATATPWVASALALAELVGDKLSFTPSRKTLPQFGARILSGALCGGAVALGLGGMVAIGALAGISGALVGTLVGAAGRAALARALGKDLPAALLEDAVAVGGAALLVSRLT